jgi:hypothetical protein
VFALMRRAAYVEAGDDEKALSDTATLSGG